MFGRDVRGAEEKSVITSILQNEHVNLVIIGAGLPNETREEVASYVSQIRPDVAIHLIKRQETSSPYDMIEFTNRKAVEWKVAQQIGKRPTA